LRIRELELDTAHPEDLARFYGDRLDARVDRAPGHLDVTLGATRVRFVTVSDPVPPAHFAINVPPRRFDDVVDWLRARVSVLDDPRDPPFAFPAWNAHSIYALDPEGNVLEWIARHRLADRLEDGGDGVDGSIQVEVSEVGIAVDDVDGAARALSSLPGFGEGSDRFRALGDDRGLLILSARGRPWFPTEVPADPVRMRISIDAALPSPVEVGGATVEGVG